LTFAVKIMYQAADDLVFLPNSFDTSQISYIDGLEFQKGAKFLQGIYKSKTYTLALDKDGIIHGFNGSIYGKKLSDLLIVRLGPFKYRIFEKRFWTGEGVQKCLLEWQKSHKKQPAYTELNASPAQTGLKVASYAGSSLYAQNESKRAPEHPRASLSCISGVY